MAQITHGVRRILSSSLFYDLFQTIVGAKRFRRRIVERYLRPQPGMHIIDVGCGTGAMLDYLPEGVRYYGFDLSHDYIEHAKNQFGARGEFYCAGVADASELRLPKADLIIAIGLLHHLDDAEAIKLIRDITRLLTPSGRCIAVDPCFEDNQSRIARWFLERDRGQNVRDQSGYLSLTVDLPVKVKVEISRDLLRIPYTHSIIELNT
ncbi:MAG TPA: class I SAM-dependent methyltransferase [Rhodanobacter sp.]|jgi:cyclopropane fatty-acyl-phospholipid synthase-like methyltransferase|nr:class I SAM-dependent methyltransferase [Rhodanobacter sp.]